jgi:hypothetical protein
MHNENIYGSDDMFGICFKIIWEEGKWAEVCMKQK